MKNSLVATLAMLVAGSVMAEEIGSVSETINAANQNEAMTLFAKRKRPKKKKTKSHSPKSHKSKKKGGKKSKRASHNMDGAPSASGNEAAPPPPTPTGGGAPVSTENI